MPTIFLYLFFHLQEHTNPISMMDANCHPHLPPKHAHLFMLYSPGGHDFFITQGGYKNYSMIVSIHLPNQEVPAYPQKHVLILHVQKLYQVRLANSSRHDYLGLVQFDLVNMYFCSK